MANLKEYKMYINGSWEKVPSEKVLKLAFIFRLYKKKPGRKSLKTSR